MSPPIGCCGYTAGGWWWTNDGSSWRRSLDAVAAEGFDLVNSFTVDDNVYLVAAPTRSGCLDARARLGQARSADRADRAIRTR